MADVSPILDSTSLAAILEAAPTHSTASLLVPLPPSLASSSLRRAHRLSPQALVDHVAFAEAVLTLRSLVSTLSVLLVVVSLRRLLIPGLYSSA